MKKNLFIILAAALIIFSANQQAIASAEIPPNPPIPASPAIVSGGFEFLQTPPPPANNNQDFYAPFGNVSGSAFSNPPFGFNVAPMQNLSANSAAGNCACYFQAGIAGISDHGTCNIVIGNGPKGTDPGDAASLIVSTIRGALPNYDVSLAQCVSACRNVSANISPNGPNCVMNSATQ